MKKTFTTALFIITLCFSKQDFLAAQVNVQDSLALVDLYNSTNGLGWYRHDNWLTTAPVSTWYGITVTKGRVSQIALGINILNGSIPASLGTLAI